MPLSTTRRGAHHYRPGTNVPGSRACRYKQKMYPGGNICKQKVALFALFVPGYRQHMRAAKFVPRQTYKLVV
jgi:hypothetical protein